MNIALVIGKENSQGLPGKNTMEILGRPSAEYAFIAAKHSICDKIYVSTDSEEIANIGNEYGALHIDRPKELANSTATGDDVLEHAYKIIKKDLINIEISTISLMICNNPAINVNLLNEAIKFVEENDDYDSCCSVARYDMFSPVRAKKIEDGEVKSFIDAKKLKNSLGDLKPQRNAYGAVYFYDFSIQVLKPRCVENIKNGNPPFKRHGNKVKPIKTDFGFDLDNKWQKPVIEYWLKEHGFTEKTIPWE